MSLYDEYFLIKIIKLKTKGLQSRWLSNRIKKSSKRKQRLYKKLLKNKRKKAEIAQKNYKKLFEQIKKRAKSVQ